jgi:hypothetical protein
MGTSGEMVQGSGASAESEGCANRPADNLLGNPHGVDRIGAFGQFRRDRRRVRAAGAVSMDSIAPVAGEFEKTIGSISAILL